MANLRIYNLELAQQPGSRLRIYDVSLEQVAAAIPDLGSDQLVESQSTVNITATVTGSPSSWTWTQTAGPTVTLSGSGASRSFTAPATVDGALITLQAVATISGIDTPPGSVNIAVRAHQWWVRRSGVWKPFASPVII